MAESKNTVDIKKGKADYNNFRDPFGLLFRMLKSGNRAAYFSLFREGLSVLFSPMDWILAPFEKKLLKKTTKSDLPVILILGGSRSGTTLLYQTLTQYLDVSYFNNFSAAFPRSPIICSRFFNKLFRKKSGDFKNYYGSVSGLNGPNDAFHIWNRWLGTDRNAVPKDIPKAILEDMHQFLNAWNSTHGKPLLNKNNRNSLAISYFETAWPNKVFYITIERDPVYTVQSLIKSRAMIQGDKRISWGLGGTDIQSQDLETQDPLFYIDEICEQVISVNRQIKKSLKAIPVARQITISYEAFCQNPGKVIHEVSQLVFKKEVDVNKIKDLKSFKNTNSQFLPDEEFEKILKGIKKILAK